MQIQTHNINGKTARVFPFPPNWSSAVSETLEWKTDIIKAYDGVEQRRALRTIPRRGLEYRTLLKGDALNLFESLIYTWQHRYFAMPVWTDIGRLRVNAPAGLSVLPVDTDTLGFRAGDAAILFESASWYEVVQVFSVTSDSITLTNGLTSTWLAGARVFPLILGHLGTSVSAERHTGSVAEASIALATSPDTAYSNIPDVLPSVTYDGLEVITARPNWGATIQNDFSREFEVVDATVGPLAYYDTEKMTRISRPFSWFLKDRQAIRNFRAVVGRLRGMSKTCWIPSWHDDFALAASNASNQWVLTVKGTTFANIVGIDSSRDRLAITLPNGNTVYRKIVSLAPDYGNGTTAITLDASLNTTIGVNDNTRLQLLLRCRLGTDKIVIPWRTDTVATPQTVFTTVRA